MSLKAKAEKSRRRAAAAARKEAQAKETEKLLKEQEARVPEPVEVKLVPGETPPLHIQNLMARAADKRTNDLARQAAAAVANTTLKVLKGQNPDGKRIVQRYAKAANAQAVAERARASDK